MLETLPVIVVLLTALYLLSLGVVSLVAPARAAKFLLGFSGSAFLHYIELSLRLAVGGAFLVRAPYMPFSATFALFGWILIITTACLFAVAALAMGSFIFAAVIRGDAA